MSSDPTLDLRADDGIPALDFSALTRVVSAVYPSATISNIPGGYRITLAGGSDLPGLPARLRELAESLDDCDHGTIAVPRRIKGEGTESAISDVISGLMTDFDEWHVIKRTSSAEPLLDWLRRMGRSKPRESE